jgi:hypothetical protein
MTMVLNEDAWLDEVEKICPDCSSYMNYDPENQEYYCGCCLLILKKPGL